MSGKKRNRQKVTTAADRELIAAKENLLIEKEKRYQATLKKNRKPQVEKLTALKEVRKKSLPKPKSAAKPAVKAAKKPVK